MNDRLKQLYQTVILQHDKHPVRYEKREEAAVILEAYNPLCGDKFTLFLTIENDSIQHASFHGYGCAISKASTSVLVKNLEGKKIEELKNLVQNFRSIVDAEATTEPALDSEFEAFAAARQFPGRLQCATLSWDRLADFLIHAC